MCHLKPGGAVLDVGCGPGVLLRRLPASCYSRYVGIDLSASAVGAAQAQSSERTTLLAADCEQYCPEERFDVIVFNEVLYYLRDPLRTVERYTDCLSPGGLILTSLCMAARASATILSRLKRTYTTLDEVRIEHGGSEVSWVCTVLRR